VFLPAALTAGLWGLDALLPAQPAKAPSVDAQILAGFLVAGIEPGRPCDAVQVHLPAGQAQGTHKLQHPWALLHESA